MKEYQRPEVEIVDFTTEPITDVNMSTVEGDDDGGL